VIIHRYLGVHHSWGGSLPTPPRSATICPISARARAKGFPGNGGFPYYVDLEGESSGRVTVRQGAAIVFRRGDADGNLYSVRLVAAK
jgi:hypothetical protein